MASRNIIVVGASAGGIEALREVIAHLPAELPAAVLIVVHLPAHAPSVLPAILTRAGQLTAVMASDGVEIRPGRLYVAPPDHHLLVRRRPLGANGAATAPTPGAAVGHIRVARGPKENGHRPAIDPLFRSAAFAFGPGVIGVVLSGNLDDGTAGLNAIIRAGGVGVVQDPATALYPDMPASAVAHARPQHVVPIADIAPLLVRLVKEAVADAPPRPTPTAAGHDAHMEDAMAELDPATTHAHERPGEPSGYGCPDCGGSLFEFKEGQWVRFRCRVGHAYAPESLLNAQTESVEDALWSAVRALEENSALFARLAARARRQANDALAARYTEREHIVTARAETIRRLLLVERPSSTPTPGPFEPTASATGRTPMGDTPGQNAA